jgi:hypothetical protein
MPDPLRGFLRHTLATLAYRAAKPLRGAPPSFETFRAAPGTRSAGEILAHLIDLLDWALSMAQGQPRWKDSQPLPWGQGTARFFAALRTLDDFLASSEPLQILPEKLFQGPIADALTHVGQLALLRRAAAAPVRGENYYLADIVPGRVGLDQAPPVREFD